VSRTSTRVVAVALPAEGADPGVEGEVALVGAAEIREAAPVVALAVPVNPEAVNPENPQQVVDPESQADLAAQVDPGGRVDLSLRQETLNPRVCPRVIPNLRAVLQ
jgi:hypothetical protein